MRGGYCYYCERIRFKGGVGWGMSIREKVERQKLLGGRCEGGMDFVVLFAVPCDVNYQ